MSRLEEAIQDALSKEDADFLAQFDKEPNSVEQMFGVFRGPLAWIYVAFIIAAVILAPLGFYSAWKFLTVTEMRALFYWGAGAATILLILSVVRIVFFMQINTNRVLRELKRLELQVARLAARAEK